MPIARPEPVVAEMATAPTGRGVGYLLMAAAILLWSTSGVFARAEVFRGWPEESRGLVLAFWRAFFAGLLLLPAVRRPRPHRLQWPAGLMFGALSGSYLSSMTYTTVANAIWLQSTAPLWVAIFACFLGTGFPTGRTRGALICVAAGIGLIVSCELAFGPGRGWGAGLGVVLATVSGMCFGGTLLIFERLRGEDGAWIVAVNNLSAACCLLPFVWWSGIRPEGLQWPTLAAFGIVQMGIPYLLFFLALRRTSAQEGALFSLLEPVLSPLWVFLATGERPASWTVLGALLILGGLATICLPRRPAAAGTSPPTETPEIAGTPEFPAATTDLPVPADKP